MMLITKHETENVLNDDGAVHVFDRVVIHNELYLHISYNGNQIVMIFGDKMREVLAKLHEHSIKVELA